ncbi:peptidoglycan DD-metalloendopeptidase family protein [Dactylosporangium roseum]|uniref:Peptidoglycan DD-metalloendopeptidase family protein n=1 Tax=Dactylosporangium roseum TaxID=47989 RepID=A0ABY5YXV7_9ACTN|nr:peptidoglycan DD-metalloendopeptidase family protein [Dactylosporangium roseum]UWZ34367.1 peptidoglycan DD-metalloendopeptidase family protein [Dactylosporangium roseum]
MFAYTSVARRAFAAATTTLLAALFGVASAGTSAAARPAVPEGSLYETVSAAILRRVHVSHAQATAAGRHSRVRVQRQAGDWAFGSAVLTAPARPDQYPIGRMFLAHRTGSGWQASLDGTTEFTALARRAPATIVSAGERRVLGRATGTLRSTADTTYNTGLRLPFTLGQSWRYTGGPHGWSGTDTPYSSIDLNGGDYRVLAAGGGNAYLMCDGSGSGQYGGWVRVYHGSGYTTDYYHLWSPVDYNGASVTEGTFLGNTGTDVSCGGNALYRHVHWAILKGEAHTSWVTRSAGGWVFLNGSEPYAGSALHGSKVVNAGNQPADVGGLLYNYGALDFDQGIVDANDDTSINKRSGPGTGYPIVGSVADGTTVTISCWRNGTSLTGRWGASAVWDKLTDGTWVSDAFVYTGMSTVGPNC